MNEWVNLAPYWEHIKKIAKRIDEQKRNYDSARYFTPKPHLVGLCGEAVFAMTYGLKIDRELRAGGDGGEDFPGVDVKTTMAQNSPMLLHKVGSMWTRKYVLAICDYENKRARLVGWATGDELKNGQIKNLGHGDNYGLESNQLKPMESFNIHD